MTEQIKAGIIGLIIGLGTVLLISIPHPPPWTLGEIVVAVGMASFFGPFWTMHKARKNIHSKNDKAQSSGV